MLKKLSSKNTPRVQKQIRLYSNENKITIEEPKSNRIIMPTSPQTIKSTISDSKEIMRSNSSCDNRDYNDKILIIESTRTNGEKVYTNNNLNNNSNNNSSNNYNNSLNHGKIKQKQNNLLFSDSANKDQDLNKLKKFFNGNDINLSNLSEILCNVDLNHLEETTSTAVIMNNNIKINNDETSFSSDFLNSKLGKGQEEEKYSQNHKSFKSFRSPNSNNHNHNHNTNDYNTNNNHSKNNTNQINHIKHINYDDMEKIFKDYYKILSKERMNTIFKTPTNNNNNTYNRDSNSSNSPIKLTSDNNHNLNNVNNLSPHSKKVISNFSTPPTKLFNTNNTNNGTGSINSGRKKMNLLTEADVIPKKKREPEKINYSPNNKSKNNDKDKSK